MATHPKAAYAVIATHRKRLHQQLIKSRALTRNDGVVSIADRGSETSKKIADFIYSQVTKNVDDQDKLEGQRAGQALEEACSEFLRATFASLSHLRPGRWTVDRASSLGIAQFEQYQHLNQLEELARSNPVLAGALGTDYVIKPDVLIARRPETDDVINDGRQIVDEDVARYAVLRERNNDRLLLHASVSTKWTLRSDRAQNARTEALNLVRNRKGRVPHIVVVTGEPMPFRIASLALGTGDIDCVYHVFLHELVDALATLASRGEAEDARGLLQVMIDGRRLKDISDLPLDLAV